MPSYDAAINLGLISLDSQIDLRGYNRDRARMISDVNRFSQQLGQQIALGMDAPIRDMGRSLERELVNGYVSAMRQIERLSAVNARRVAPVQSVQRSQVLGASLGSTAGLEVDSLKQGRQAGQALGQGVSEGFRLSEPAIAASFNKSITGAILASSAIKFGVQKLVQSAMGTLPGQISSLVGSTLQGGGLRESVSVQLETNTATSTLAALTNLDIRGAAEQIDTLNKRLAESAAALPGATSEYKRLASILSDNLIGAFKDVSGNLDTDGYVNSLSKISEAYGALTASTTRDTGNTALALTRALGGASESQLRQFAFFEQNANALSQINAQLAKAGVQSLADLTIEGRVKLLEAVGDTLITDDFKKLAENSVDGLLQSFKSKLFDPTTGILGLNRDLETGLEGTQSVFTSFNEILRGVVGQSSDDMGLLFRLVDSAKAAGANIGDPLRQQKTILDAIALAVDNAKGKTDQFFESTGGQALISAYNAIQGVLSQIFQSTLAMEGGFVAIATVVGGPLGAGIALLTTNLERVLPVLQELGGGLFDLFQASLPIAAQFFDSLMGIAESAMPLIRAGIDLMIQGLQQVQPIAEQIGSAIAGMAQTTSSVIGSVFQGIGGAASGLGTEGGYDTALSSYSSESGTGENWGEEAFTRARTAAEGFQPILSNIGEIVRAIAETLGNGLLLVQGILPSLLPIAEIVTNLASGVVVGLADGIGRIFSGIQENSAGIAEGFGAIASVTAALAPGIAAIGGLLGEVAIQALNLAANLLSNETILAGLVGTATLLSEALAGALTFVENNEWVVKIAAIGLGIAGIVSAVGALTAGWAAVAGVVATVSGAIGFIGTVILSAVSLVAGFGGVVGTLAAAWGAVSGAIATAVALINPVTLAIAGVVAGVVAIGFAIKALWPQITALWTGFKDAAGNALNNVAEKTKGLRDRFGEVKGRIGEGVQKLDQMFSISKRLEGPFGKIKGFSDGISAALKRAWEYLTSMDGPLKQLANLLNFGGGGDGTGAADGIQTQRTGTLAAQEYGASRDGGSRRHAGQDFDLEDDGTFQSYIGGQVTRVGREAGGYGNYVDIFNAQRGVVERIAELDQLLVKVGDNVAAGQTVGEGTRDTGVVHYEIRTDVDSSGRGGYGHGGTTDPIKYLEDAGIVRRQGQNVVPVAGTGGGAGGGQSYSGGRLPVLGAGYNSLSLLSQQLASNQYFNPTSPEAAARLAIALGIGGTEAFGQGVSRTNFYTLPGGTGNNMKGFAQFNQEYHADSTDNPNEYRDFIGRILAGQTSLPNGAGARDFGAELSRAISQGSVNTGQQLIQWMQANGLGGSNWQGVDDGWQRSPGLANALVNYLKGVSGSSAPRQGGVLPDRQFTASPDRQRYQNNATNNAAAVAGLSASAAGGSGAEQTAAEVDLSPYINVANQAQRALEVAQTELKKRGQLNQQARQEEDRDIARQREQRKVEIERDISALDPEDNIGRLLLEQQQQSLQIEETVGDRVREANRNIEDLENARTLKIRSLENVAKQRAAYEEAMARGIDTGGITEESLKKLEADISPIDYTEAIAEYGKYRDSLTDLIPPQTEALRNRLIQAMDAEIEKAEDLVVATTNLNNQYGNVGDFAKYQQQVVGVGEAYGKQREALEAAIVSLDRLTTIEGLSAEQQIELIGQRVASANALKQLTDAEERAYAVLEKQYNRQQEANQVSVVESLLTSRIRLLEAQAKSIERFDSEGATTIRRRIAETQLLTSARAESIKLTQEEEDAIDRLNQAIAENDIAFLRRQSAIGRGSEEDITGQFDELRNQNSELFELQLEAIAQQFPTVADAFKNSMQESFSSGLESGLLAFTQDGDIFGLLGGIFENLFDTVIKNGVSKATEYLSGKVFGNGDRPGWLDELFGENANSIPSQSEEAARLLAEGGMAAGRSILEAANEANMVLAQGQGVAGISSQDMQWDGPEKDPGKTPFYEAAGVTLGRTFAREMPTAGRNLTDVFARNAPNILEAVLGNGPGKGKGLLQTGLSILGSIFYDGGYVANYAGGGGIAGAFQRERSRSGSGKPRLIVANTDEFILSGPATRALTQQYGPGFLDGLNSGKIANYAGGGFASMINPVVPAGGYGGIQAMPRDRNTTIRADFKTVRIGDMDFVSADQFAQLQEQINQKASAGEAAEATLELMRDYTEVRSRLRLDN